MSVQITIHGETAEHARNEMLQLLGFGLKTVDAGPFTGGKVNVVPLTASVVDPSPAVNAFAAQQVVAARSAADVQSAAFTPVTPGREHGKAGPGRQRRTKAEIEEDERYPNGFPTGAAAQADISSGAEDRVNPDDQQVGEDDAADEEADGIDDMPDDGSMPSEDEMKQKFTKDDLRALVGKFGQLFKNDMLAVELAVTSAFESAGVKNISGCPDDKIEAVYRGLQAVGRDLEANPEKIGEISKKAAKLAEQG